MVFSSKLHAGQLRGLHQTLSKCWREFEERGSFARTNAETAKRKARETSQTASTSAPCLLLQDRPGWNRADPGLVVERLARISAPEQKAHFRLRVLITDRAEWTTAQIIEAYRGQWKVEAAFRDLKDPRLLATRPQFHWTDQKKSCPFTLSSV